MSRVNAGWIVGIGTLVIPSCATHVTFHEHHHAAGAAGATAATAATAGGTGGGVGGGNGRGGASGHSPGGSSGQVGGGDTGGIQQGGSGARGGDVGNSSGQAGTAGGGRAVGGGSGGVAGGPVSAGGSGALETGGAGESGAAGDGVGCPMGFSGPNCEVNIDDCAAASCGAHAHCVDGVASHTCACNPGFTGTSCDLPRLEVLTTGFGLSCGNAISADGTVVVGYLADTPRSLVRPFRWTKDGGAVVLMSNSEPVDYGNALAVSADASVVAGYASMPSGKGVFRWTNDTGITIVGPDDQAALSSNGATLVGRDTSPSDGTHLYRWTMATGVVDLGRLGAGANISGVSGDGTTVIGNALELGEPSVGFIWDAGDGAFHPGAVDDTVDPRAVDADGRIVVGDHAPSGASGAVAFRWDRQHGLVDIDLGNLTSTTATAITRDGKTIVGRSGIDGWTWSEVSGANLVSVLLSDEGFDVSGFSYFDIRAVSDDGTVITGCLNDSTLATQAFIARLGN